MRNCCGVVDIGIKVKTGNIAPHKLYHGDKFYSSFVQQGRKYLTDLMCAFDFCRRRCYTVFLYSTYHFRRVAPPPSFTVRPDISFFMPVVYSLVYGCVPGAGRYTNPALPTQAFSKNVLILFRHRRRVMAGDQPLATIPFVRVGITRLYFRAVIKLECVQSRIAGAIAVDFYRAAVNGADRLVFQEVFEILHFLVGRQARLIG